MRVGVLSYQGSVIEHINALSRIKGITPVEVKYLDALNSVDAIILPGGESTAISKLLRSYGLFDELQRRIKEGMPVWGTCAGMILLAKDLGSEPAHLAVMDIKVMRNAYGSQLDSFSKRVMIDAIGKKVDTVFIRAPIIQSAGENVEILLKIDDKIVAARQNNMLATSFHPELTDDLTFYKYFLSCKKEG